MPQSVIKVLVHIVFSTKDRIDLIDPQIEEELYKYIHGVAKNNGSRLITGNGTANHSHLLVSLGKVDVPKLIGDIKRSTSLWMKKEGLQQILLAKRLRGLLHRESQVEDVSRYIQAKSTMKASYKNEFRALCRNTRSR